MAKFKLPSYPETISSEISLPVDGNKTFWMLRSSELPNNKVPPSGSARVRLSAQELRHDSAVHGNWNDEMSSRRFCETSGLVSILP